MKKMFTLITILLALATVAVAGDHMSPTNGSYQKVSELVALPDFINGMGTLYVQPATLPVGPFLAYDRDGTLVSTIYMVPLDAMQQRQNFKGLAAGSNTVRQVDLTYNSGHAGVETPHYHVTIWHVDPATANLQ